MNKIAKFPYFSMVSSIFVSKKIYKEIKNGYRKNKNWKDY